VLARDRIARAFAASGIVMAAVLALVTWDVQYRYMTWPVVATLFALVLVIKERTASASRG
jgi:hypothetical protein